MSHPSQSLLAQSFGLILHKAIYKHSAVYSPVSLQPSQVAHKLHLSDKEGEIESSHKLHLKRIDIFFVDAPDFGIKLVFVIEIIEIFSSHHNTSNKQSE